MLRNVKSIPKSGTMINFLLFERPQEKTSCTNAKTKIPKPNYICRPKISMPVEGKRILWARTSLLSGEVHLGSCYGNITLSLYSTCALHGRTRAKTPVIPLLMENNGNLKILKNYFRVKNLLTVQYWKG